MVVGLTTTCTISAYHHLICEFEPRSWKSVLDTTLYDKVCHSLATGRWYSPGTPVSFSSKTNRHDITDINPPTHSNKVTKRHKKLLTLYNIIFIADISDIYWTLQNSRIFELFVNNQCLYFESSNKITYLSSSKRCRLTGTKFYVWLLKVDTSFIWDHNTSLTSPLFIDMPGPS